MWLSASIAALCALLYWGRFQELTNKFYQLDRQIVYPLEYLYFGVDNMAWVGLFMFLGFVCFLGTLLWDRRYLIAAIIFVFGCLITTYIASKSFFDFSPRWKFQNSIHLTDYAYHLVTDNCYKFYDADSGCFPSAHLVYQCDSIGWKCHLFTEPHEERTWVESQKAVLIIGQDGALYLEIDGSQSKLQSNAK